MGNGQKIRIWYVKWIPNSSSHKVVSPRISLLSVSWVSDLINKDKKCWNSDMLKQVFFFFFPFEVEYISGIPLSNGIPKDMLIWAETNNGVFTVICAYK